MPHSDHDPHPPRPTVGSQHIRISLPQLGAISSIATLLAFVVGFFSGYQAFKSEMNQIRYDVASVQRGLNELQGHVSTLNRGASEDRLALSQRLTTMENETKWIKEGVAELRLRSIPDRRLDLQEDIRRSTPPHQRGGALELELEGGGVTATAAKKE